MCWFRPVLSLYVFFNVCFINVVLKVPHPDLYCIDVMYLPEFKIVLDTLKTHAH